MLKHCRSIFTGLKAKKTAW